MKKIHGIEIESRYDDAGEIQQMKGFVELLYEENPSSCPFIKRLFYDSNNSYCTFIFNDPQPDFDSEEMRDILHVARRRISQFQWVHGMEHSVEPD
jgi:hypothetical protein